MGVILRRATVNGAFAMRQSESRAKYRKHPKDRINKGFARMRPAKRGN